MARGAAAKRQYNSPRRAQTAAQTRQAVIEAAARLFTERGWSGTSMRDVAREAGVAVETVYSSVGQKRELLLRVIDVGVVGDDEPVPLADRPEFKALGVGDRADRFSAVGRLLRVIYERSIGPDIALREAALSDPELTRKLEEGRTRQRGMVGGAAEVVLGRALTEDERDEVWVVVSFEVYRLLIETAGWTPDRYQDWVAGVLTRLFPAHAGD